MQTKMAAPTLKGITFSRNIWKPFTPGAMLTLQRKNKKCQVSQANQSIATCAQADKLSIRNYDAVQISHGYYAAGEEGSDKTKIPQ